MEVIRQIDFLAIGKPVRFCVKWQIGFFLPVISPGIRHSYGPFKSSLAGQLIRFPAQMPFAGHIGMVSGILQQGGDGYHVFTQYTLVVVMFSLGSRQGFGHIEYPVAMAVHPGHQHPSRRRTGRCRVIIGKHYPLISQPTDVWRLDLAPIRGYVAEPKIVGQDQHNIGTFPISIAAQAYQQNQVRE